MQFFEPSFEWLTHLSSKLFWAPPSFDWLTLLSTILRNQLFRGLFLVIYSYGQFYEPSSEQGKKIEHFFEHLKECTYSQGPSFEWVYSHECSFEHFLKGSWSTRTLMGQDQGGCSWSLQTISCKYCKINSPPNSNRNMLKSRTEINLSGTG